MVTYDSEMVNAILFSEDLTTSTFFSIENDEEPDDHYTQLTLSQIFHAVLAREGGDYNDVEKISFDYLGPDIEGLADGYRDINDFAFDKESYLSRWDQFVGTQLSIIAQILVPSKEVSKISFTKDYPSEMRFYSRQGMHNTMHVYLDSK
ncbi:hypothetical protein CFIMG_003964RA [Ceratocystis fimbriata CBS 114723]|uniref:Uncharacterized protein n=1 Tax=Ceratocystis fimbriata CBS 114723 TaxID=1035309 RepID=A0A2C5XGX1_9PEZI|nr:hypothetical protein CFIMG_003964RA [Ceratocystis fimbriata CBS 114723]